MAGNTRLLSCPWCESAHSIHVIGEAMKRTKKAVEWWWGRITTRGDKWTLGLSTAKKISDKDFPTRAAAVAYLDKITPQEKTKRRKP